MKGNKTLLVALTIVVIGIWALVGFRIYDALVPEVEVLHGSIQKTPSHALESPLQDSVDYSFNDPFLKRVKLRIRTNSTNYIANTSNPPSGVGGKAHKKRMNAAQKSKSTSKIALEKRLTYSGLLVNRTTGDKQAIILMDSTELMVGIGSTVFGNQKIKSIDTDSVVIEGEEGLIVLRQTY